MFRVNEISFGVGAACVYRGNVLSFYFSYSLYDERNEVEVWWKQKHKQQFVLRRLCVYVLCEPSIEQVKSDLDLTFITLLKWRGVSFFSSSFHCCFVCLLWCCFPLFIEVWHCSREHSTRPPTKIQINWMWSWETVGAKTYPFSRPLTHYQMEHQNSASSREKVLKRGCTSFRNCFTASAFSSSSTNIPPCEAREVFRHRQHQVCSGYFVRCCRALKMPFICRFIYVSLLLSHFVCFSSQWQLFSRFIVLRECHKRWVEVKLVWQRTSNDVTIENCTFLVYRNSSFSRTLSVICFSVFLLQKREKYARDVHSTRRMAFRMHSGVWKCRMWISNNVSLTELLFFWFANARARWIFKKFKQSEMRCFLVYCNLRFCLCFFVCSVNE